MNYWFKRRTEGWGFTPVTWQGWTVLIGVGVLLVAGAVIATVIPGSIIELVLVVWIVVLCWIGIRIMIAKAPPKQAPKGSGK